MLHCSHVRPNKPAIVYISVTRSCTMCGTRELNKYNINKYVSAIDYIETFARICTYIGGQCSVPWLQVHCHALFELRKHTLMSQPSGGASQHSRGNLERSHFVKKGLGLATIDRQIGIFQDPRMLGYFFKIHKWK